MILIIGTPDSGKSELAENIMQEISCNEQKAYIATMIPFDEEGQNRIKKHRIFREGKNFVTIEEAYCVSNTISVLVKEEIKSALLECVSNLVGNVIHSDKNINKQDDTLINDIVKDICNLSSNIENLIVVANNFETKDDYDEDTKRYIYINNSVNEKLKGNSDICLLKEKGEWIKYENN